MNLLLLAYMIYQTVVIGSFGYQISYSPDTLGKTEYPLDDSIGPRYIVLPTMEGQVPISWEHEKIHACMHDHSHHYTSESALRAHLDKEMYSEEEIATILAPCLLALEKVELRHEVPEKK